MSDRSVPETTQKHVPSANVPWEKVERLVPGYAFVFGRDRAIRKVSTGEVWYLSPTDEVPEWMVEHVEP